MATAATSSDCPALTNKASAQDPEANHDNVDHQDQKTLTTKDILAQQGGVFPMDEAIANALPQGQQFQSVENHGISAWTITGKLIATDTNGEESAYFVKVAYGKVGHMMLKGEYESSKIVYGTVPDFIPVPYGFGRYKSPHTEAYFYLSEFGDMDVETEPDADEFAARLAELHRLGTSPNGKFGFAVRTCDGDRPHNVEWRESWSDFYRSMFLGVCELDVKRNGSIPEFDRAVQQIADKVIPRLLGSLDVKPCIIHGDLWEGNMGIRKDTGRSILFDVGSYYAHNEMELGHWRCEFSSVFRSESYIKAYLGNFPAAAPVDEFDDRNRLYSLKGAINYSAGHPGSVIRKTAYNNMCYLIEKFCPIDGIDKYDPRIDPSVTGARFTPHLADGLI